MFIGALNENLVTRKHLNASNSYYQDSLTWCVQTKKAIPRRYNLVRICTDWYVILLWTISVFCFLITHYVLQQFEDIHPKWDWHRLTVLGFANITGFCYNTFNVRSNSNRMFYAFCLLSDLHFTTVTSVFYFIFMTNPIYEDQVDSIRMIHTDDYTFGGDAFAFEHLKNQNEV